MNQQGVTFLEIVVVIAILMITSALVAPSIQDWRQKRALETDYQALLAQIDYLKVRARTLNGTALLVCSSTNGSEGNISYKIASYPQVVTNDASGFPDHPEEDFKGNVLTGKSKVYSNICVSNTSSRGIFLANGKSGVEHTENTIKIYLEPSSSNEKLGGYEILVSGSTSYVKKSKITAEQLKNAINQL